ncbi:peptidyl-alpha-hydroxyglycine alpha-amidating lyase 2-like [Cimex lectularius]|uniref:peptidylamidoglycolate lyase n=1 Tax=Cimex lectularius TaxID=79782 RepID=A0A8I6RKQ0_CIMLE|nr:peptidyl-alpha-hydroxyglycine alpha-amidating lyase 2-like [Cimex lectularius]
MAGVACFTCYLVFIVTVNGGLASDLRERFYSQIRDLLEYSSFPKDGKELIPKPTEVRNWGTKLESTVGQISGVSVNSKGQPVIFHRGPRKWDETTFNSSHYYQKINEGPISVDTIVTLDPANGDIIKSWGKNLFFLPHGLTIDHKDNVWVTDVAMHQVLKFPAGGSTPTLRLGEYFTPGHGENRFCKPTSVAIARTGAIFVADGYCNRRVLKFSHEGELQRIFPQYDEFLSLLIPHSLALIERADLLCVADRENMRVACFRAELKDHSKQPLSPFTIHQPDFGRVFGIAARGNLVYAVNGPTSSHIPVQGFTIDPLAEQIVDHWMPIHQTFTNPHDIAISPLGDALYISEIEPHKLWKFSFGRNTNI